MISELVAKNPDSMEGVLEQVPHILPPSWQYPEKTTSRVIFYDNVYVSENFQTSEWLQSAKIWEHDVEIGRVEVYYLEEMPTEEEGPFLHEEPTA